jgi:multidrug resistance efflux pump
VQVGQVLLSLVRRDLYVIANFKENQLEHIRPGQPVTIISTRCSGNINANSCVRSVIEGGSQLDIASTELVRFFSSGAIKIWLLRSRFSTG